MRQEPASVAAEASGNDVLIKGDLSLFPLLVRVKSSQYLTASMTLGDGEFDIASFCDGHRLQSCEAVGSAQSASAGTGSVAPLIDARAAVTAHWSMDFADLPTPMTSIGDATGLQCVGQVQRPTVNGQTLNAAHKVVTVHLAWPLLDGLNRSYSTEVHGMIAEVQRSKMIKVNGIALQNHLL